MQDNIENQETWKSATPAVCFLVFAVTVGFFALFTNRISNQSGMLLVGVWVFMIGFAILVCAVIDFRLGDTLGGTINAVLGVMLGIGSGGSFIFHAIAMGNGMEIDKVVDSWYLFPTGIIVFVFSVCASKRLALFSIALFNLSLAIIVASSAFMGSIPMNILPICGWSILISGIMFFYMGIGLLSIESFGKPIIPLGRPLFK